MNRLALLLPLLAGCGGDAQDPTPAEDAAHDEAAHEDAQGPPPGETPQGEHEHAEDPLGTIRMGELEVELAQGHGPVVAGEEAHLVVKLPYSDGGATIVRAWIGIADRTLSYVGKGEYARSHDDYDVHATAPDPLPADPSWWIELEQPDGTKILGSARPILE